MVAIRALQRRVVKLEKSGRSRPSPIAIWFGSIDVFVDLHIGPDIANGKLDALDMMDIVAALRRWEVDGTWDRAHAY
jgi:hypothetical protein